MFQTAPIGQGQKKSRSWGQTSLERLDAVTRGRLSLGSDAKVRYQGGGCNTAVTFFTVTHLLSRDHVTLHLCSDTFTRLFPQMPFPRTVVMQRAPSRSH